jgi:rfaE bifunctional protein kinase chain/domain
VTEIREKRLEEILKAMKGKKIAVLGDLMLDKYIWGSVQRISPEAPVPVVETEKEQARLGGAANVAKNIQALGGQPILLGVVGKDSGGASLRELVRENNFEESGIVVDPARPTTVKTRIIAHEQHVARIDHESKAEISTEIEDRILRIVESQIKKLDAIIIEDYNKGMITRRLISRVIALANRSQTIVNIDPKFNNFFEYKNVTVFKPNRAESEQALGARILSEVDSIKAGKEMLRRLKAKNVLLTLGASGMTLFREHGAPIHVATKARSVADVSGAGDTVIATLTLAMAADASVLEAAALANYAGGIVCASIGIVPVERAQLRTAVLTDNGAKEKS